MEKFFDDMAKIIKIVERIEANGSKKRSNNLSQ